jgi:hypothetical protein
MKVGICYPEVLPSEITAAIRDMPPLHYFLADRVIQSQRAVTKYVFFSFLCFSFFGGG